MKLDRLLAFLAQSIKKKRTELAISHDALAVRTGLSAEYLEFIEAGGTNFSMKTLSLIADGLGIVPSELIEDAEQQLEKLRSLNEGIAEIDEV